MADKKISQLTAASALTGTELVPVVQSSATVRTTVSAFLNGLPAGSVTPLISLAVDNISIDGNTIASTNTDGNITLDPNGSGYVDVQSIQRVTISEGEGQQLYSTATAIFTGSSVFSSGVYGSDGGAAKIAYVDWRATGNHSPNSRGMALYVGLATTSTQTAGDRAFFDADGSLKPVSDGTVPLGGASNLWSVVYASTGTINTSDARDKTPVRPLTAAELNAAKELSREIGAYKFLSAIEAKGNAARMHIGLTVQRAIEIMKNNNLDPMAYGFICYDKWNDIIHKSDESGAPVEVTPAGDKYSFRPDELLLFIARGFDARLSALENA